MKKFLIFACLPLLAGLVVTFGFSGQAAAFDPFGQVKQDCPTATVTNDAGQVIEQKSDVCAADGTQNPLTGSDGVITTIANIFALLTGVAAVFAIIIGGFEYVRSGGESAKVNKAKNTILFAVIGLVIVLVARGIVALAIGTL